MKRKLIFSALLLCCHFFAQAQQSAEATTFILHFETNSSELAAAQRAGLSAFLKTLAGKPGEYSVGITGHTDARGSDAFNRVLSSRRGRSVSDFLVAQGFILKKIALAAEGESRPAAENDSDQGMSRNRRVELAFRRESLRFAPTGLVPVMKVHFQAERGITFESSISGSKVIIPAGILVYSDGSPVQGEVELRYREWRNLYEYLSFGLPMHYNNGQEDYFFNSAGMFEVQAFQKDQELGLAPGKSFSVSFVQTQEMPDVNLYVFNENTGAWTFVKQKNDTAARPSAVSGVSVSAWNTGSGRSGCRPNPIRNPKGKRPVITLAESIQTGYELASGKRLLPPAFVVNPLLDDTTLVRETERTTIHISKYDDSKAYFFVEDKQKQFTELNLLNDLQWEYVPSLVSGEFNNSHLNIRWDAAYLSYDPTDVTNLFDVKLVSPKLKIEIKARLRQLNGRPLDREEATAFYKKYKTIQKERWDNKLEEVAKLRRFVTFSMLFREENEVCMGQAEWLKWFVQNKKSMVARYEKYLKADYAANTQAGMQLLLDYNERCRQSTLTALQQQTSGDSGANKLNVTLQIFGFGIYNCDQIFRLGAGTEALAASFKTRDGKPITSTMTNVVEKNSQMMLSAPTPGQIYFSPDKTFDIIVRSDDNRTYLLRESEFATLELAGKKQAELVMDDVTEQIQTPNDWIKVLGI